MCAHRVRGGRLLCSIFISEQTSANSAVQNLTSLGRRLCRKVKLRKKRIKPEWGNFPLRVIKPGVKLWLPGDIAEVARSSLDEINYGFAGADWMELQCCQNECELVLEVRIFIDFCWSCMLNGWTVVWGFDNLVCFES